MSGSYKLAITREDWVRMFGGAFMRPIYPKLISEKLILLCPCGCLDLYDEVEI